MSGADLSFVTAFFKRVPLLISERSAPWQGDECQQLDIAQWNRETGTVRLPYLTLTLSFTCPFEGLLGRFPGGGGGGGPPIPPGGGGGGGGGGIPSRHAIR